MPLDGVGVAFDAELVRDGKHERVGRLESRPVGDRHEACAQETGLGGPPARLVVFEPIVPVPHLDGERAVKSDEVVRPLLHGGHR